MSRLLPVLTGTHRQQRLAILNYHRVLAAPDPMRPNTPVVEDFHWQMTLLSQHFSPLPLDEAVTRLQEGTLPQRAVCVTFDDGYADNARLAAPVLASTGVPATVFVACGFLDGGLMWNDAVMEYVRLAPEGNFLFREQRRAIPATTDLAGRRSLAYRMIGEIKHLPAHQRALAIAPLLDSDVALPGDLMMGADDVRQLGAEGIAVGAHTISHPILASIGDDEAWREISEGKHQLEEMISAPVTLFAYPNGKPGQDYSDRHCRMIAQAGFKAAVSTRPGVAGHSSDPFQLPRFTPWDKDPSRFLARLLLSYRHIV
ncbi:polysaccharide deacetylase family protein [Parahaliea aestuarii]|uniref:Polysaccharide deacetylase family protein n=2 Tax=Parahaliea aestuarii TaxID=1852021 RepID=A0A5C8ZQ34_9GAMM|nr:polysaccharide deacetylase family protein [Parahaliea aestuarii]